MIENKDNEFIEDEGSNSTIKTDRIPYTKAIELLIKQLPDTTPAELAAWIFIGREDGGLTAYCIPNELPKPKPKPKQSAAEKKKPIS